MRPAPTLTPTPPIPPTPTYDTYERNGNLILIGPSALLSLTTCVTLYLMTIGSQLSWIAGASCLVSMLSVVVYYLTVFFTVAQLLYVLSGPRAF